MFNINKLIKKNNKSINLNIGKESDNKNNVKFFKKVSIQKKNIERDSGKKRLPTEEDFNNLGDMNSRLNSFLDFSVLNNKEEENISKEKFGIIKNSIWDVSVIKDVSYIEKKDGF